jgi:HPt (histidine-containing phosphotransfer) domain-containing protein
MVDTAQSVTSALDELAEQLSPEMVVELVDVYVSNSAEQIQKLDKALACGDLKAISAEAHSLKSSSANMGATVLGEACRSLEHTQQWSDSIQTQIVQIKSLREQAANHMISWKKQRKAD